jgi:V/A-type H+-transporting ATPase subunit I
MGVKASKLIQITVKNNKRLPLLAYIQKTSIGQIIERVETTPLDIDAIELQQELLEKLDIVNKTIDIYKGYQPSKPSLLDNFIDGRIAITEKILHHYEENIDEIIEKAIFISDIAEQKDELLDRQEVLEDIIAKVEPIKDIEIDIFESYQYMSFLPFLVDESRVHIITKQLQDSLSPIVLESVKKINTDYVYILAVPKSETKIAHDILESRTTLITFPAQVSGSFYNIYHNSLKELQDNKKTLRTIDKDLKKSPIKIQDLYIISDIITSHLNLITHLHMFIAKTENTSTIELWVDGDKIEDIKKGLSSITKSYELIPIPQSKKVAPVIMKNPIIVRNFETITKTMGLPKGNAVDPTPYLLFSFPIMFGIALSDAGYALLFLAITGIALLHPRLKPAIRNMFMIIFISSIFSFIIGTITGNWFGLVPDKVDLATALPHVQWLYSIGLLGFLQTLHIIDPLEHVVEFMLLTASIGIIHISFGLILGFIQSLKQKEFWEEGVESVAWFAILVFGITLLLINMGVLGQGLTLLITPLLIFYALIIAISIYILGRHMNSFPAKIGKGVYELFFGVIAYLSEILSYTRLVALGLAGSIIAEVVGTLAGLAGGGLAEKGGFYFVLGYLIIIIIFILGNIFNIILSLLATYINVGRLHFVEFFSKFFKTGGESWKPLTRSHEYSIIEKS